MNATPTTETTIEPHEPHWLSRAAFQLLIVIFFVTQAALGFAVYRGFYWLAVPLVLISSHLMHGMSDRLARSVPWSAEEESASK